MFASPDSGATPPADTELEEALAAVEARLTALGVALLERDSLAVDTQASELHHALARAVDDFTRAARHGTVPPLLRLRLMRAGSQVAAQRESFARATAALDRAIDVLFPREAGRLHSALGASEGCVPGGSLPA